MSSGNFSKKLAVLLSIVMFVNVISFSAYADTFNDHGMNTIIVSFDALPEDISFQNVTTGSALSLVVLPDVLMATNVSGSAIIIHGVIWKGELYFDSGISALYTFTPMLPTRYMLYNKVVLPIIYVQVGDSPILDVEPFVWFSHYLFTIRGLMRDRSAPFWNNVYIAEVGTFFEAEMRQLWGSGGFWPQDNYVIEMLSTSFWPETIAGVPTGLSRFNQLIWGTPTRVGTFRLDMRVQSVVTGASDTQSYIINVIPARSDISSIAISNITPPVTGAMPSISHFAGNFPNFTVDSVTWRRDTFFGTEVTTPFSATTEYVVRVRLTANDGFRFHNNVAASVNGQVAWVGVNDNFQHSVDIIYTFPATAPIYVTGVSLNRNSATILQDSTETLVATVNPLNATNRDVLWSSSDNNIVTVNANGLVTAISPGEATITVTTVDGNHGAVAKL